MSQTANEHDAYAIRCQLPTEVAMSLEVRLHHWWNGLTEAQRSEALAMLDDVPPWMVSTLDASEILVVDAIVQQREVVLMPTLVREFIERQRQSER